MSVGALTAPPAEARGDLTLRVLQQNIYGRSKADCRKRFRALGRKILQADPPYDIISLNEHWKLFDNDWIVCNADVLTEVLESDGRYSNLPGFRRNLRHYPKPRDFYQTQGGNSIFTRFPITFSRDMRFVNSRHTPVSGALMARVLVGPGLEVDVYVTHLEAEVDGCDDLCRAEQYSDMTGFLTYSLPEEEGQRRNPVLLMGDFNFGGPLSKVHRELHQEDPERWAYAGNGGAPGKGEFAFRGYEWGYEGFMEEYEEPRDVWLEANPYLPLGHTYDCAGNTLLDCDYAHRLDYIFIPGDDFFLGSRPTHRFGVKRARLVQWKTSDGENVSDHYGVDALLTLKALPAGRRSKAAHGPRR